MSAHTQAQEKGRQNRWIPSPKTLITLFITLILVIGEWRYGITGGYDKLALTLGSCVITEIVLSLFLLKKWPGLQSAYITGTSLSLLLRPAGGLYWPYIVAAALSIAAKYVLRYRGKHLWNPSNFALAILVLLAPSQVALLSHELGNDLLGNAVIWTVGLLVVSRAKVIHISIAYAVSFSLLALLRSALVGTPALAELAPLTGPMYQLLCFFMLTDPPTTVASKKGQVLVVVLIAVVECLFRMANDFEWPFAEIVAPAPPIISLFVVGPIALAWDLKRRQSGAAQSGRSV
ncbi:MAG: RnfABCDGE type electron transport complex subunit D [Planctomycetota bacterium]|nr:RnfABCDGE type electron transport complex subunit D [Planctomycetota bacterium]